MNLPIPKLFTQILASASLLALTAITAEATTFTSSQSGTWTSQSWVITNRTAGTTNTIPGPYDDVMIASDHSVTANQDIFITSLSINGDGAANTPKVYTIFNLNGYSMLVKTINLIGGTNDKKKAELNLAGGIIEVMGPTTNLTTSGAFSIIMGANASGTPG